MPQNARICALGGVKSQFGQCPNIHGFFLAGASLIAPWQELSDPWYMWRDTWYEPKISGWWYNRGKNVKWCLVYIFQQCCTTIIQSIYISSLSVWVQYFGEQSTPFHCVMIIQILHYMQHMYHIRYVKEYIYVSLLSVVLIQYQFLDVIMSIWCISCIWFHFEQKQMIVRVFICVLRVQFDR